MFFCNKSYGAVVTLEPGKLYIYHEMAGQFQELKDLHAFNDLEEWYGYTGPRNNIINISTLVTIKKSGDKWNVKLGNKGYLKDDLSLNPFKKKYEYTTDDLKNIFAYEEGIELFNEEGNKLTELQDGAQWRVVITAEFEWINLTPNYECAFYAKYVYSGKDIGNNAEETPEGAEELENAEYEEADKFKKIQEFLKHAVESSVTAFLNGIIHIGDGIQTLANMVQTGMDNLEVVENHMALLPKLKYQ